MIGIVLGLLGRAWKTVIGNKYVLIGLISFALLCASYWLGHHNAKAACKADAIQSELNAKKAELEKIKSDNAEAEIRIKDLEKQKTEINTITNTVIKKVPVYIPDNRACDVPAELIAELNKVRK